MPTPSAVSETGPSVFLSACSGRSESEINLSIDFLAKIWRARVRSPAFWIYRILMIVCGRAAGASANIQLVQKHLRGRNDRDIIKTVVCRFVLLNPSLGNQWLERAALSGPLALRPKNRCYFPFREAISGKYSNYASLQSSMTADHHPMVCDKVCAEVLDVCVAGVCAPHNLPVRDNLCWRLNNGSRPRQLLRTTYIEASGNQCDTPRLYLLDGHASISGFFAELVLQLDQMDEVRVLECDAIAPRIDEIPVAQALRIPGKQVKQGRYRQERR